MTKVKTNPFWAMSSSDLKDDRSKRETSSNNRTPKMKEYDKNSVVSRLHQAASRAHLRQQLKDAQEATTASTKLHREGPRLASLQKLNTAIDLRLDSNRFPYNSVSFQVLQAARDPMIAVVSHNQQVAAHQQAVAATSVLFEKCRQVAIVLSKSLQKDQVTVEYANRIRRLLKAMLEEDYHPDAICFVGGTSTGNKIADADAGYMYFRYLCACQNISLDGIQFILEYTRAEQGAFQNVVDELQQKCLPLWRKAAFNEEDEDYQSFSTKIRRRLRVHFSIVSSEYHLCQLNDIHVRSPGQSPLRALGGWMRVSVDTTWAYQYSTTMLPRQKNPARSFCAKHYKTAQRLVPALHNLRGVVDNREFFQRDNYRVLVSARRSLVTDMEKLYHRQPSLKDVHKLCSDDGKPMDVILESALLNLGRCLDLVRPAGLLTGIVSSTDWSLALTFLEQAVQQICKACDPDEPLDYSDWGSLGDLTLASSWTAATERKS